MRSWRTWNLISASALEEWNGDSGAATGDDVNDFCWPRRDVIFRAGVELGIKVNLHTSRYI